jgi:hypothetical protein
VSRVALAPSAGRAAGALLTVILRGSMLEHREDGSLMHGERLRWVVTTFSCAAGAGGPGERADAAVARRA